MGTAKNPEPVKLFLAIMYTDTSIMEEALDSCKARFGDIDIQCGPLEVNRFTNYYDAEMGKDIKKLYIFFNELINRGELAAIKTFTNTIEQRFIKNKSRLVNLDPGYLSIDKLVLATTKDFYQRMYLSEGIFAEITLHYQKGRYRYFSWTYPDYKDRDVQTFFEQARAQLGGMLRKREV